MFRKKRHANSYDYVKRCAIQNSMEKEMCCAQFGVNSNPPSGEMLRFFTVFQQGNGVRLSSDHTILLAPGHLYLINYVFLAATEAESYMQIMPYINDTMQLLYAVSASSGTERNTYASAGFTMNQGLEQEARLEISLTYPEKVKNIDITGSVSVTPIINGA